MINMLIKNGIIYLYMPIYVPIALGHRNV